MGGGYVVESSTPGAIVHYYPDHPSSNLPLCSKTPFDALPSCLLTGLYRSDVRRCYFPGALDDSCLLRRVRGTVRSRAWVQLPLSPWCEGWIGFVVRVLLASGRVQDVSAGYTLGWRAEVDGFLRSPLSFRLLRRTLSSCSVGAV